MLQQVIGEVDVGESQLKALDVCLGGNLFDCQDHPLRGVVEPDLPR